MIRPGLRASQSLYGQNLQDTTEATLQISPRDCRVMHDAELVGRRFSQSN